VGVDAFSGQKVVYVHTKYLNILKKISWCIYVHTKSFAGKKDNFFMACIKNKSFGAPKFLFT
jgi:hypothetical protein